MNPIQELIDWFNSLPVVQRDFLARVFFFLTSEQAADLGLSPQEARRKFILHAAKQDFPPRMIARLVQTRTIINFILENRSFFAAPGNPVLNQNEPGAGKISLLEPEQWRKVYLSWLDLKERALSDHIISELLQRSGW